MDFILILAWLRRNCMKVFHYVANQLLDTPLFESKAIECERQEGAVYNDFDYDTNELLEREEDFSFGHVTLDDSVPCSSIDNLDRFVPQSAIDHAVLSADRNEEILYNLVTFDTDLFDCESLNADDEYMRKVSELAAGKLEDVEISCETIEIFHMRERLNWSKADSVFDAWLIQQGISRPWFPVKEFVQKYPMFKADKLQFQSQSDNDAEEVDKSLQQAPERRCNVSPSKEGDDADDTNKDFHYFHSSNETTKRQRKRIGLRICSDEENQEEEDIAGDNLKQDTRLFPTEDAIEAEDDKDSIQKCILDQNEKDSLFLPHVIVTSTIVISSDEENDTAEDTDLFKSLDGDDESNDKSKIQEEIMQGNRELSLFVPKEIWTYTVDISSSEEDSRNINI